MPAAKVCDLVDLAHRECFVAGGGSVRRVLIFDLAMPSAGVSSRRQVMAMTHGMPYSPYG